MGRELEDGGEIRMVADGWKPIKELFLGDERKVYTVSLLIWRQLVVQVA